ncbi:MAG: LysR family carnitine catabolism transcriptional activator [Paraglaciecola sp.]
MLNISHRQLQAFVCVAQSSTFAEASEKMCLSQPALSTSIKKMELQLGGALFFRSTRKVALSPEGRLFLPVAIRLLNDWDDAMGDIHTVFSMGKGKLSIAAMPSFAAGMLPEILQQFQSGSPNIKISVADIVMESVIGAVRHDRVELGFTFETEQLEGIEFHPMFTDTFIAVLPADNVLATSTQLSWQQLCAHPFVAMNRGSAIRSWIQSHVDQQGLSLNIVAEAGQLATLGQFVKHGLGISVVPGLCKEQMSDKGLCCLPIKNSGLVKRAGMIKKSRGNLSVAAASLWDWVVSQSYET